LHVKRSKNAEPVMTSAPGWMADALTVANAVIAQGEGDLSAMGEFTDVEYKVSGARPYLNHPGAAEAIYLRPTLPQPDPADASPRSTRSIKPCTPACNSPGRRLASSTVSSRPSLPISGIASVSVSPPPSRQRTRTGSIQSRYSPLPKPPSPPPRLLPVEPVPVLVPVLDLLDPIPWRCFVRWHRRMRSRRARRLSLQRQKSRLCLRCRRRP
jgi:hypothetical protein